MELPSEFVCPLTLDVMHSPVSLRSSAKASYERCALEMWLAVRPYRDPLTNCDASEPLAFVANSELQSKIRDWRRNQGLPPTQRPAFSRLLATRDVTNRLGGDESRAACVELADACVRDAEVIRTARRYGAIETLTELIRDEDQSTAAAAARALAEMCRDWESRYVSTKAHAPLAGLLSSRNTDCQACAALALWRIAKSFKVWVRENALWPLLALLRDDQAFPPAQFAAAGTIWTLLTGHETNTQILALETDAIHAFVRRLDAAPLWRTSRVAGWALYNLACAKDPPSVRRRVCRALGIRFVYFPPDLATIKRHIDRRVNCTLRLDRE